jgi:hypothetical protein
MQGLVRLLYTIHAIMSVCTCIHAHTHTHTVVAADASEERAIYAYVYLNLHMHVCIQSYLQRQGRRERTQPRQQVPVVSGYKFSKHQRPSIFTFQSHIYSDV